MLCDRYAKRVCCLHIMRYDTQFCTKSYCTCVELRITAVVRRAQAAAASAAAALHSAHSIIIPYQEISQRIDNGTHHIVVSNIHTYTSSSSLSRHSKNMFSLLILHTHLEVESPNFENLYNMNTHSLTAYTHSAAYIYYSICVAHVTHV